VKPFLRPVLWLLKKTPNHQTVTLKSVVALGKGWRSLTRDIDDTATVWSVTRAESTGYSQKGHILLTVLGNAYRYRYFVFKYIWCVCKLHRTNRNEGKNRFQNGNKGDKERRTWISNTVL